MLVCPQRVVVECYPRVARRAASASVCNSYEDVLETIKSRKDFSDLFSRGKRWHTPFLTFIVLPSQQHDHRGRVAFAAGKKLGNSVWRNGARRRMREICRTLEGPWAGYDVIFLAKSNILVATYSKVLTACDDTLKRAKIR